MPSIRPTILTTLICLCGFPHGVAAEGQPIKVCGTEIKQRIRELDADSFHVREAACHRLMEIGEPATDDLRKVISEGSLEARYRARGVFRRILGSGLEVYLPVQMNQLSASIQQHREVKSVCDQAGRKNQAAHFPGRGYWIIRDSLTLDSDEEFTIAVWIKPTRITYTYWKGHQGRKDKPIYPWGQERASWSGHFIASQWNSRGIHGDYIFAITPSGKLGLSVSNSTPKFQSDALFTPKSLNVGKWVHLAGSFDRGKIKLYIDGQLQCEKESKTIQHTNRQEYDYDDLYIGDF